MNKNIIKAYAMKMTKEDVKGFATKEGINLTNEEAELFVQTVKENADYILEGHGMEVIESKKDYMSEEAYLKLVELFNKYKKFID